ncbi:MAG: GNAT family N-acetyltransferase [Acidimicrobiales bacterium]
MPDERTVIRATLADLDVVKATRLRALEDAPYAFASTLEREQLLIEDEWRSRIESGAWFLAYRGGRPVGVVAAFTEVGQPSHRHLVSMWVEPAERGTSIAADLVEAVISWADEQEAHAVTLWIADGNARAHRLYERLGFVSPGRRQSLPSDPSLGVEEFMRRLR